MRNLHDQPFKLRRAPKFTDNKLARVMFYDGTCLHELWSFPAYCFLPQFNENVGVSFSVQTMGPAWEAKP